MLTDNIQPLKKSPMTFFSSFLCPNVECRDTVYNISSQTDDLLSVAELHKNKTIQKKNTEKERRREVALLVDLRAPRPPRTCREQVCFTAHAGGEQRHLVVKLTRVFGSLRIILLEKH